MKVKSYLSMLGIAAMLASCSQNEDLLQGTNDSSMKSVTVAVNLEGVNLYTRALTPTTKETDAEVTRCYMEVLEDGTSKELVEMTGNQTDGYTSTLSLNPEKEYKFLFWADGGEDCYTIDAAGQRLQDIKVKDGAAVSIAYQAVKDWDKAETVSAELTHAVAKVSLKTTTDLKSGNTVSLTIPSYSGYKVGGNTDDTKDIFAGTEKTDQEYTTTLSAAITGDATNGAFVFSCYVLNNQNEGATLQYSDNPATPVYNVPLKANQHSTLLGDLANLGLTSTSVTATINPDWDDAGTIEYPQATADATSHTIKTYNAGQIAKTTSLISTAIDTGSQLTIEGPMDDTDIEALKTYLVANPNAALELDLSGVTELTTFPYYGFSDYNDGISTLGLKSIVLPNVMTKIDGNAFRGYCTELESVTLPAGLKEIGGCAFFGCSKLSTIKVAGKETINELPEGLTTLKDAAFGGTKLETITIPSSLTTTTIQTLNGMASLKKVYWNSSAETPYECFGNCTSLTDIYFTSETAPAVGSNIFGLLKQEITIHIPAAYEDNYSAWKALVDNGKEWNITCITY